MGTTTASVTCVPADAEYTIYEELDASGKWAYRNLVPDADCSNADLFYVGEVDTSKGQTALSVDTEDYHSGGSSITRILRNNGKIGFEVTNYDTAAEYYVAAWLKANCKDDEPVSASYASDLYTTNTTTTTKTELGFSVGNTPEITNEWGYYTTKVSRPKTSGVEVPAYTGTNATRVWLINTENSHGLSQDSDRRWLNEINVDDWSWRKIPNWKVNATGVNVNGNTAVFTFDKDIDKWTVTADKLLVNGKVNNNTITSAVVATDELTRVTTLTVTATENIDDDFVISLPDEARDAWGRKILNIQSTGFVIGKAHIIDATGEIVSAEDMTAGTRSYKVTGIQNNSANPVRVASIIALYNANGVCLDVRIDSQTFAKGTIGGELCASLTIPKNAEAEDMYIKTFLWDMNTLYPYNKPLKVLVIGNSYTYHTPNLSYGWIGDWGMAASAPEKDYVHQLQAKLQDVNSGVQMKWFNISNLEKYYLADDVEVNAPKYYQEAIDFDADVIIATFGANIGDGTWEGDDEYENVSQPFTKDHYKYIIDKFNPDNDAVVIAGNTMSEKTDLSISKKEAISAAAQENGYIFVDVADIITNYPAKAEYVAEGGAEKYKNALDPTVTESRVIYEAVLTHPGDEGMKLIAERLFNEGLIPALKRIGIK